MSNGWSEALGPAGIFVVEGVAIAFVSRRVARRIAPDPDAVLDRALVAVLVGVFQIVGVLQVLGIVHALYRGWVLLAHIVVAAVVAATVSSVQVAHVTRRRNLGWYAVLVTGSWLTLVSAGIGVNGVSAESDTVQYHLPNVAFWLRGGSLWKLPYATAGYFTHTYPSNGELVGLWAILPTHDDRLAYVTPLLFAVLAVLAGAVIARELGGNATLGALGSIAVLAMPVSFDTQTHGLMVDWAVSATLASGVALALVARRTTLDSVDANESSRWIALSALSLGCAVGTKYTVLPLACACFAALIALQPRARWRSSLLIAIPAASALSAFWFVRNWIVIGNPLFPKAVTLGGVSVFRGGKSPLTRLSTSLLDHMQAGHGSVLRHWLDLADGLVAASLVVVVLGLATALWVVVRKRDAAAIALVVLIGLGSLFYFATPYTGGGPAGIEFLVASQFRYVLPVLLLAGAAAGAAPPPLAIIAGMAGVLGGTRHLVNGGPGYRHDFAPSHSLLVVMAVVAIGCALACWFAENHDALTERLGIQNTGNGSLVLGTIVVLAGALVLVHQLEPTHADDPSDALLARGVGKRILTVGVNDFRSLLGVKLDNNVITPGGGGAAHETPYRTPAQLDARIRELHPAFLVVGNNTAAIPPAWRPEAYWHQVGVIKKAVVYSDRPSRGQYDSSDRSAAAMSST